MDVWVGCARLYTSFDICCHWSVSDLASTKKRTDDRMAVFPASCGPTSKTRLPRDEAFRSLMSTNAAKIQNFNGGRI
jgi:hypothetical protein